MSDFPWEIVLGPPGTGKTTELLRLVEEELAGGTPPDRIGYVSFTRRATEESQSRAAAKFNLSKKDFPFFRTIHSLCMRWLGYRTSQIMEAERLQEFAQHMHVRITGRLSLDDGTWTGFGEGDRMLFMDGLARVRRQPLRQLYEEGHDDLDWRAVERFSSGLAKFKEDNELIDYTDMLEMFVLRGTAPVLDVLIVDESQDLSELQWDVIRVLARGCRRVVVAGDDDQSIFGWAGGSTTALLNMPGSVRVLGQSYRVPRAVQRVADEVIARVRQRRPKAWAARDEEGTVTRLMAVEQADWSGESVLVLTRNRYQLESIAAELRADGVFFENQGHLSVRRPTVDAIVVWERLRRGEPQDPADVVKCLEWTTHVKRGNRKLQAFNHDEPVTMSQLLDRGGLETNAIWHVALDRMSSEERTYLVRCRRRGELFSRPPRVRLQTIHGSKGGEAHRVVLLTDLAPRTYAEARKSPEDEARVFYVGTTRAQQELCIVAPKTNMHFRL